MPVSRYAMEKRLGIIPAWVASESCLRLVTFIDAMLESRWKPGVSFRIGLGPFQILDDELVTLREEYIMVGWAIDRVMPGVNCILVKASNHRSLAAPCDVGFAEIA